MLHSLAAGKLVSLKSLPEHALRADSIVSRYIPFLITAFLFLIIVLLLLFGMYLDSRIYRLQQESSAEQIQNLRELVRWMLVLSVLTCLVGGVFLIRSVKRIVAREQHTASRLLESEQRMKLALSGANEGTWDLDVASGELNFDTGWGKLLGYAESSERPRDIAQWSALIHNDDRERVLGILQSHINGELPEYKVEYRIRSKSGKEVWVAGHGKAVTRDAKGRAIRIVGVTRDITFKKAAEDTIWRLAHFDQLTSLPNRILLKDRLQQSIHQALRHDRLLAVFFMDLDGFKQVNDTLGHEGGDELLQQVAARMGALLRSTDTLARQGGDEFILLMTDLQHKEDAAVLAQKIISALNIPFQVKSTDCTIGCSIGIAFFPADGKDAQALLAKADQAMYQAKAAGKNSFRYFPERMT